MRKWQGGARFEPRAPPLNCILSSLVHMELVHMELVHMDRRVDSGS